MQKNNYQEKIEHITGLLQTPNLYYATVAHDDWCRYFKDSGGCNCDPEITIKRFLDDDKWEIVFVG